MTPLEILHDALLDGELDAARQTELRQLLADPEQRRAWRRLATFSGRMGEELAAGSVARLMAVARPARRRVRPRRWSALAAALLMLGIAGWWVATGRSASSGTPSSATGAMTVTGGTLRSDATTYAIGSELPAGVALVGEGEGSLAFADGTTCSWSGPIAVRRAGPRRLALDRGDARIALPGADSELAIVTAFATATGRGARFRVRDDASYARIGVDAGTVTIVAGDRRAVLGPGQMLTALVTGLEPATALTPPASWAIRADQPGWGQPDWRGVVEGTGVRPQSDPDLPPDDPRRLVQASADVPPGMVEASPSAVARLSIRADRAGSLAAILICKDSFSGEFLGHVVADIDLVGGGALQRIEIPLSAFRDPGGWTLPLPGERETPAAIFSILLQWWGDDLGSRVESIAIGR